MRIFFFILLIGIFFILPWWVGVGGACLYALRFRAYELCALGMLLDASYGTSWGGVPFPFVYTLGACALVVAGALGKPYIRLT